MVGVGVVVLATACQAQAPVEPVRTGSRNGDRAGSHGDSGSTPSDEAAPEAGAPARRLKGSDEWRMTQMAKDGQIEAYTTRVSAPPGDLLELKVSTSERAFRMSAYRIGDYDGGTGQLVHRSQAGPRRAAGRRGVPAARDPHRRGAVAREPDRGHDRLGAGLLRAPAADRRRAGSTRSRTSSPRPPRPGRSRSWSR